MNAKKTLLFGSLVSLGVVLLIGSSAVAGPLPGPFKPTPKPKITVPDDFGLKTTATVKPEQLAHEGVAMDLINAHRVESSASRVLMTNKTQLVAQFIASPDREYRVECRFSKPGSVNVLIQTKAGTFVQQQQHSISSDRIVQIIHPAPGNRQLKVTMQAQADTTWNQCTFSRS